MWLIAQDIDMHTFTYDDMTWKAPFKLTAKRNDYVHALLAYFDIEFSDTHKPVKFTTRTEAKPTHWKQSVFYVVENLTMVKGESLSGQITVTPNEKNFRDLDINISVDFSGDHQESYTEQFYRFR